MLQRIKESILEPYQSDFFFVKKKAEYFLLVISMMFLLMIIAFFVHVFIPDIQNGRHILQFGDIILLLISIKCLLLLKNGKLEKAINLYLGGIIALLFIHNIFGDYISNKVLSHFRVLETAIIICSQFFIMSLIAIKRYQLFYMIFLSNITVLAHIAVIYFKYYSLDNLSNNISDFMFYFFIVLANSIICYIIYGLNSKAIKTVGENNEILKSYNTKLKKEVNQRTLELSQTIEKLEGIRMDLIESKSFLRIIIDTAPIFIAYIDKNYICKIANNKHVELFGSLDKIENHSIFEILPKDMHKKHLKLLDKTIKEGETNSFNDKILLKKDRYMYVYGIYTPFYNINKKKDGVVAIVLDVTEQKSIEKEMRDLNKELSKISITDPLTKVNNRRRIIEIARNEFNESKKNNQDLSLCMIDIDHFKRVNDTYGHAIGDLVLKKLANECKNIIRKVDSFGRFGGEEFIIILPETDSDSAFNIAERIRNKISNMEINNEEEKIFITISIGVSTLKDETKINDLINKADKALYDAKNNGRNQVKRSNI
ncbi:MAG: diguanylate cyclase [Firmicutes bacterium]|nr:diguanylate cyclase [Bacillota bacterium]